MPEQLPHSLTLNERTRLTVTGVTEVLNFDDTAVVLRTGPGLLLAQGIDLRLNTLDPAGGHVVITGTVSALSYEEPRDTRPLWHRLWG